MLYQLFGESLSFSDGHDGIIEYLPSNTLSCGGRSAAGGDRHGEEFLHRLTIWRQRHIGREKLPQDLGHFFGLWETGHHGVVVPPGTMSGLEKVWGREQRPLTRGQRGALGLFPGAFLIARQFFLGSHRTSPSWPSRS